MASSKPVSAHSIKILSCLDFSQILANLSYLNVYILFGTIVYSGKFGLGGGIIFSFSCSSRFSSEEGSGFIFFKVSLKWWYLAGVYLGGGTFSSSVRYFNSAACTVDSNFVK